MNQNKSVLSAQAANGPVRFNMTNDYMFRAVLQENNKVLRGLICSLLHLSKAEVISAEITNPIILGESIAGKEFRLDINVRLNDRTLINLEMQVDDRMDWPDRSLLYLCRSYDQLGHGQEYMEIQGTGAGDKKYLLDDISKEVAEYLKQAGEEEGAQVPE